MDVKDTRAEFQSTYSTCCFELVLFYPRSGYIISHDRCFIRGCELHSPEIEGWILPHIPRVPRVSQNMGWRNMDPELATVGRGEAENNHNDHSILITKWLLTCPKELHMVFQEFFLGRSREEGPWNLSSSTENGKGKKTSPKTYIWQKHTLLGRLRKKSEYWSHFHIPPPP